MGKLTYFQTSRSTGLPWIHGWAYVGGMDISYINAISLVPFFQNFGTVMLVIAGAFWWLVSFGSENAHKTNLKQAAFFTAIGFFLYGISLLAQAL